MAIALCALVAATGGLAARAQTWSLVEGVAATPEILVNVTSEAELSLPRGGQGAVTVLLTNPDLVPARLTLLVWETSPAPLNRSLGLMVEPAFVEIGPFESTLVTVRAYAFHPPPAGTRIVLDTISENGLRTSREIASVSSPETPAPEAIAGGGLPAPAVALAVAAAAGVGGIGLLLRREPWRYLGALALAPLYTRLAPARLLKHEKREALFHLISQEPGINYSELKRRTVLPAGVLVHHLRTLERHHLVVSRRDGMYRRYTPTHAPLPPPKPSPPTAMQQRVLDLLQDSPLTQRQIAEALGITQQGANRHVKALERRGLVAIRFEGGVWQCHALPAKRAEATTSFFQ